MYGRRCFYSVVISVNLRVGGIGDTICIRPSTSHAHASHLAPFRFGRGEEYATGNVPDQSVLGTGPPSTPPRHSVFFSDLSDICLHGVWSIMYPRGGRREWELEEEREEREEKRQRE